MSGRWGASIIYGLCQMGKTREALFTAWLSWFRHGLVPIICVKARWVACQSGCWLRIVSCNQVLSTHHLPHLTEKSRPMQLAAQGKQQLIGDRKDY